MVSQARQPCVIRFQAELVVEKRDVDETGAGQALIERLAGLERSFQELHAQNAELHKLERHFVKQSGKSC